MRFGINLGGGTLAHKSRAEARAGRVEKARLAQRYGRHKREVLIWLFTLSTPFILIACTRRESPPTPILQPKEAAAPTPTSLPCPKPPPTPILSPTPTSTFYPTPTSLPNPTPNPVLALPPTPIYQPPTKELKVSGSFSCQIDSLGIEITNLRSTPIFSEDLLFKLDNLSVPCSGLPESVSNSTKCTITGIPSAREHIVEVFAEREVFISVGFRCPFVIAEPAILKPSPTIEQPPPNITSFVEWAKQHSIHLVGINKSANEVYYQGLDEVDKINLSDVPYWWGAEALRKIPEKMLQVMEGKTIYFSAKRGRGYALITAFLRGTTAGFILEQLISDHQAVHEFAHILDFVGIKGEPGDPNNILSHAKAERNRLFNVSAPYNPQASEPQIGFISIYSAANDQENFAEHFFFYIFYPQLFRDQMQNDTLLKEKYEFFKKWIFEGKEY